MARVTVEDCIVKVPNRFELVMMAGQRARDLTAGSAIHVDRDNDKNPVVALREIAEDRITLESLRNDLIKGHQKVAEPTPPGEDVVEAIADEQEWGRTVDARSDAMDEAEDDDPTDEAMADADENDDDDEEDFVPEPVGDDVEVSPFDDDAGPMA